MTSSSVTLSPAFKGSPAEPPGGPIAAPDFPAWVPATFARGSSSRVWSVVDSALEERQPAAGPSSTLLSYRIRDALSLDVEQFERAVVTAYRRLFAASAALNRHPVRIWNVIPALLQPLGSFAHRYMAFNRARHEAFRLHAPAAIEAPPTASGTGNSKDGHFYLFCLSRDQPGEPVENPRQVPAFRYSERYGPRPPCFSRGTKIADDQGAPLLLIAGTASVVGEESVHVHDWSRQLEETFRNLAALARAGCPDTTGAYAYVRVYVPDPTLHEPISRRIEATLGLAPGVTPELVLCDLCRPDLLVEIEGAYRYQPPTKRPASF